MAYAYGSASSVNPCRLEGKPYLEPEYSGRVGAEWPPPGCLPELLPGQTVLAPHFISTLKPLLEGQAPSNLCTSISHFPPTPPCALSPHLLGVVLASAAPGTVLNSGCHVNPCWWSLLLCFAFISQDSDSRRGSRSAVRLMQRVWRAIPAVQFLSRVG